MPTGRFYADLIGRKFYRWTVVSRTENKSANGSYLWNVICDCGATGVTNTGNLVHGKSKSCGCYLSEIRSKLAYKHGRAKRGSVGYKEYQREAYDKHKYGITKEQKDSLFDLQEGKCAICGYVFGQKQGDMHIDHCHTTGVVRGLLCNGCNTGIGHLQESKEVMLNAISYLTKYSTAR